MEEAKKDEIEETEVEIRDKNMKYNQEDTFFFLFERTNKQINEKKFIE